MFFSFINKKIIIAIVLIIIQLLLLSSYIKKSNGFNIITLIIHCIPGIIAGLIIYTEKARGRF